MPVSYTLIIENDAGVQAQKKFSGDVLNIGRGQGNEVRLGDRNVSRFHAKLLRENNGFVVEDLGSFNGVKLNGERIAARVQVAAGDVIEIGDYHLELRAVGEVDSPGVVGSKALAAVGLGTNENDEFGGETQRWEPPPQPGLLNLDEEPTARSPALGSPTTPMRLANAFHDQNGDTERVDLSHLQDMAQRGGQAAPPPMPMPAAHAWPPPTIRPAAVPVGAVTGDLTAPMPAALPSTAPLSGGQPIASRSSPHHEATVDLPMMGNHDARLAPTMELAVPMAFGGPSSSAATQQVPMTSPPSMPPRRADETEQIRPAPAGNGDLALPRLVVLNTVFAGSSFALKGMENLLGRVEDNDIVIDHRSIPRNHAKLVREGDRVRILDLKSSNGVFVNDANVEQHILKSGDVVELGKVRMRFVPPGERFTVSAVDIEKARAQDLLGLDDDLAVSSSSLPMPATTERRPVVLYAVLAVLLIAVVVLGGLYWNSQSKLAVAPPVPDPVAVVEGAPPPPRADVTPTPIAIVPPVVADPSKPEPVKVDVDPPVQPIKAPDVESAKVKPVEPAAADALPAGDDRATPAATEPRASARAKPAPLAFQPRLLEAAGATDFEQGVSRYKALLRDFPKNPQVYNGLVRLYANHKDCSNARVWFDRWKAALGAVDPAALMDC